MLASLLAYAIAVTTPHPLLRQAEQAKAQLAYKEALALLDLALAEDLSREQRRDAAVLRAEILAGWQCNLAAVQALHAVLEFGDWRPEPASPPKVIDCFDIAVGTQPKSLSAPVLDSTEPPAEVPWRWVSASVAMTAALTAGVLYAHDVTATRGLRSDVALYNERGDTTSAEEAALKRRKHELRALDWAVIGGGVLAAVTGGLSIYLWLAPAGAAAVGVEGEL